MDVFDLYAKIGLDKSEYESGLKDAKGSMSNLAKSVGDGLKTVAKVGAAAVTAAATGVAALTKMSVEGFAEYEQLVGGVETLFKTSQNVVMKYAENAYKTAGMSANEYMSTVTSFSASLIQSLGGDTAKAAEVGDMAITDMSDNANKMGTSIEMIQNAYQGFAKQNYTMLDNLKLGYGGTKEEMARLIDDANKVKVANGEMADLSIDSFADVAEAIHIIQTEMGITGTTAREAASTIEGSLAMMKGAWQNLVVGIADENANMTVLINNFVESTATAAQNLLPRIEQALIGIGQLITALAPVIADALPVLIEAVLPSLLSAAVSLVTALVNGIITALPALYDALLIGVQTILVEVFGVSEEKAGEFADGVNSFFVKIKDGFMALVESAQTEGTFLNQVWTGLQETGRLLGEFLSAVWEAISTAFTWAVEQINTDGTFLNQIWTGLQEAFLIVQSVLNAAFEAVTAAFTWAVEQINTEGSWLNEIFTGIQETVRILGDFFDAAWTSITNIFAGCVEQINTEGTWLNEIWNGIKEVVEYLSVFVIDAWNSILSNFTWCVEQINTEGTWLNDLWVSIQNALQVLSDFFSDIWNWVVETFTGIVGEINTEGTRLNDIFTGIQDVIQGVSEFCTAIFDAFSSAFSWCVEQINTEGTWLNEIWTNIEEKVSNIWENIQIILSGKIEEIKGLFSVLTQLLHGDFSGAWETYKETISNSIENAKEIVSNVLSEIGENVGEKLGAVKKKFTDIWDSCEKIVTDAVSALKNALSFDWSLPHLNLPHISVDGGEFPYGIGGEGSLPSFSIEWYKKAYDNAMVLSNPTIFGFGGGSFLGGGDGNGNEIVAGESHLMNLIGQVVESKTAGQNERIIALLSALLSATVDGNNEMVSAIMTDKNFTVGEREFARLVREYA